MPEDYRFDNFELQASARRLLRDGASVKLGGRAFDLLLALVERRDRVVAKAELLDVVWPRLVVEENNLQVQVTALRGLLGPDAIATVPGRGYRFTAAVHGDGATARAAAAAVMNRRSCFAIAVATAVLLGACAALDSPRRISISEAELKRLVDKAFPIERRLLEVFEVSVASPQLRLLGERNRIATALEVRARDRLFGGQWSGRLAFDSALRWEPSDRSVRLSEVRVGELNLDAASGASAARRPQAERLGAVLAENVLEDLAIYRLPPERAARLERAGVMPGTVTITPHGVTITLQPLPR